MRVPSTVPQSVLKRHIDLILATALLILAAPVLLVSAVLIRLTSPGPVIYRQTRIGFGGRDFEVLKLRSMIADAERDTGPVWAAKNDARITNVGRYLRKYRIDELPQLVNVIRGEMSLVGPRPERRLFAEQLRTSLPHFEMRTNVLPGITGLAQIEAGYSSCHDGAEQKLKHDLTYVRSACVALDLQILVRTIRVVMCGAGR